MQPSHSTDFLRCHDDRFTPVRDTQGRLLGCVPRVADNNDHLASPLGERFELRIAAQVCVCVDLAAQTPTTLDGFIPLGTEEVDLALPAVPPGEDPDLAVGV